MIKAVIGVTLGLVAYIVVNQLVSNLVTGTTAADNLITSVLGLAVAVGVVIFAFTSFLKGGPSN